MDRRTMQSLDLKAARRFRFLCIAATSVIAAIAILSNVLLWLAPQPDWHDASIINIAGRQRMLSQKIAKAATAIHAAVHELDYAAIAVPKVELQTALNDWTRAHEALFNGDPDLMVKPISPGPIRNQLLTTGPCYQQVVDGATDLLNLIPFDHLTDIIQDDIDLALAAIHEGEQDFLPRMNHVVGLLETDAANRASDAGSAWVGMSLAMLVILAVLAISLLVVFEPAMRMLNQKVRDLRRALDAAEEVSRMKSAFLANVSHEIRTPMTAILGFTDLLLDDDKSLIETQDAAQTIRRNGEHLLAIINDILDLSKIEAGSMTVEKIDCSVEKILEEVGSLMQVRADAKELELVIQCDRPIPDVIKTDPLRLRQILINLLGNAIKFTPSGQVTLKASIQDLNDDNIALRFDVIDSGIGLSHEQAKFLFEPFSQADVSTTRRFGGTGLGLAISSRLATILDGQLTVQSTPQQGSTFSLVLNLGRRGSVTLSDKPAPAQQIANKLPITHTLRGRILLVEDGPDNQQLFSHLLTISGATVDIANDGKEGLEKALLALQSDTPFDLILMDMQMPVMDGYEAANALRDRGYKGPIIALTAHAMTSDRIKCLNAGCDEYLAKPVDRATLTSICQRWMGPQGATRDTQEAA